MSDNSKTETPAEVLRRAAGLMRERAEAAPEGPWTMKRGHLGGHPSYVLPVGPGDGGSVAECWESAETAPAAGAHIASWHPLVALAVAEWLEAAAETAERFEAEGASIHPSSYALKVARIYLGETPEHPVTATGGQDISGKEDGDGVG